MGQISDFMGFIFGKIFYTNSLTAYGQILCKLTYILLVSSIICHNMGYKTDLFDILG